MTVKNPSWGEKIRAFLVTWLFTPINGMDLGDWLRLLRKHRFAVDLPYWPRAALVTFRSTLTSLMRRSEDAKYGPKLAGVRVKQPLFILGQARSGTTHLHNLLSTDERFAYPNLWQALNPHTFLVTEKYSGLIRLAFRLLAPRTRLVDNVNLDPEVPFEDEVATCCATLHSPLLSWVFPRSGDYYERYLTFRGVPEEETARWKAALLLFYKKLTWKYDRPLLLKTPPHTCRIRLLLEMFPDARFVHIHRNPYDVFRSTKRLEGVLSHVTRLQRPDPEEDVDSRIIRLYKVSCDAFFEEKGLIPDGQFHEVCFEELVRDPMGQVKGIYEQLGIPGFDTVVQGPLQRYVDSLAHYRQTKHSELPPSLRRRIARAWKRSFEEWGYDRGLEEREYDYDQAG